MIIAKLNGQLFELKKYSEKMPFSNETGWVLLCSDFQQADYKKQHFKWIRSNTQFEWVREFMS
jgi:hypothetical protein